MSADLLALEPPRSLPSRVLAAHRPRRIGRDALWPADPALRLLVRLALAAPFVAAGVLVSLSGAPDGTPNALLADRAAAIPWDHADPSWVGRLYPPITTVLAAVVPGGALGLTAVGGLAAGLLLHAVIERMRRRGFALSTVIVMALALGANPLFGYAATQSLPAFLGLGLFGLGFADLVRFTTERDTQSGFTAGIMLMLAALCDPSGVVYVVVATVAAPLLSAGTRRGIGRGFANTLVVLFPTATAFGGVMLLQWVFAGDPTSLVHEIVTIDPARLDIFSAIVTTPLGWLWLASMGGAWAIGLFAGRPAAVLLTLLLFASLIGGYLLGLIPYSAAGTVHLMMVLAAIGLVPAARNARLTIAVNAIGLLELAIAWATAFNRPIVLDWMTALVHPLLG